MKLKAMIVPVLFVGIMAGGWLAVAWWQVDDHGHSKERQSNASAEAMGSDDEQLSDRARALLQQLYQLSGHGILSGQHDFLETPNDYVQRVYHVTGKLPAVHGYELGGILDQSPQLLAKQRQAVVDHAIAWSRSGGLVTMMYHASYPGTAPLWRNVQRKTSIEQFQEIITPGTPMHELLLNDMDEIAGYLQQLRDADVPVLWRPYHEMNGGWFWWGRQPDYSKLWDIMYERFTEVHQLDNLIWVWNANEPNEHTDPMEEYLVDRMRAHIVAMDIYYGQYSQKAYEILLDIADGRPLAIGESGVHPDPDKLQQLQNQYVWFMTWGEKLLTVNNESTTMRLYEHPYVLSREDVVDLAER